jgi:hypothetical protein
MGERKTMKIMTKGLAALVTAFIVLSGTVIGDGVTPLRLIMGEESWVKDAMASNVYYIQASVMTGGKGVGRVSYGYYKVGGFADLVSKVRTHSMETCKSVITNNQASTATFTLTGGLAESDDLYPTSYKLVVRFTFERSGDTYSTPDVVRNVTPILRDELTVLRKDGLNWARVEVQKRDGTTLSYDSLDDQEVKVVNNTHLRLSTPIATLGTNATVTVFVQEGNVFHKFNGSTGEEVTLTPPTLKIVKAGDEVSLLVSGDPFQGFVVESTTDLKSWKIEGYGITGKDPWKMVVGQDSPIGFFRVTPFGLSNSQRGHLMGR